MIPDMASRFHERGLVSWAGPGRGRRPYHDNTVLSIMKHLAGGLNNENFRNTLAWQTWSPITLRHPAGLHSPACVATRRASSTSRNSPLPIQVIPFVASSVLDEDACSMNANMDSTITGPPSNVTVGTKIK
ncbi:hypothetical protein E2C01_057510 [Portunus trituberculatus]|uniref:Uncharacterized protein n=1 Tax=Portunus trituberculatus TaxID=210409 RepID=A0A5B7GX04_PORTR|nr:hypothetical protein [Portunus trituberculatus]